MFPYLPQRVGATCPSVILYPLIPVTRCHKGLISRLPGELLHPETYFTLCSYLRGGCGEAGVGLFS